MSFVFKIYLPLNIVFQSKYLLFLLFVIDYRFIDFVKTNLQSLCIEFIIGHFTMFQLCELFT